MPNPWYIAAGVLTIGVAYDLATRPLRKEVLNYAQTIIDLNERNESLSEQMAYLVTILNKNDVELDEFDLMVLTDVMRME